MSWRRRSRRRGSRSRPAGRPRGGDSTTRGVRRPFIWAGAIALALAVSALAAPPIRTAVAKNRAAANARAAALARGEDGPGTGARPPSRDGEVRARRGAPRKSARESAWPRFAVRRGVDRAGKRRRSRTRARASSGFARRIRSTRSRGTGSATVRRWIRRSCETRRARRVGGSARVGHRRRTRTSVPRHWRRRRTARSSTGCSRAFFRSRPRSFASGARRTEHASSTARIRRPTATRSRSFRSRSPTSWRENRQCSRRRFPTRCATTETCSSRPRAAGRCRSPTIAESFEALAAGLEARGELGSDEDGAEGALRRARSLARTPDDRQRLAASYVRVRIKRGELEPALDLADSLLAASDAEPVARTSEAPRRARGAHGARRARGRAANDRFLVAERRGGNRAAGDRALEPAVRARRGRRLRRLVVHPAASARYATRELQPAGSPQRNSTRADHAADVARLPLLRRARLRRTADGAAARRRAARRGERRPAPRGGDSRLGRGGATGFLARRGRARLRRCRRPRFGRPSATRRARSGSSTACCVRCRRCRSSPFAKRRSPRRSAERFCFARSWRARPDTAEQQLRARQASRRLAARRRVARSDDRALALARLRRTIIRISGRGGRRPARRDTQQSAAGTSPTASTSRPEPSRKENE